MSKSKSFGPPKTGAGVPNVSTEDFEALLAGSMPDEVPYFQPGQEARGTVVRVERSAVYLDLGAKSEGVLDMEELLKTEGDEEIEPPQLGDVIEAYVVSVRGGVIRLATRIGRRRDNIDMLFEAEESGIPVDGRIVATNKGGYEVDVGGARGFCPHSQMDTRFVENPEVFLGRDLQFRVSEIREGGRNVVLSRRALLEEEEERQREETMAVLKEGAELTGTVRSVRNFGAFVNLGGIDGLVHVSEISHQRVENPEEVLSVGQEVRVRVLSIEQGGKRISLSMKALEADPWETVDEQFPVGTTVQGRVVRLQPFGAFVELAPGIDGLLHISALGQGRRIGHPKEVVSEGQRLEVVVASVDLARERVGLELPGPGESEELAEGELPRLGSVFTGLVEKVERFGLFVRLGGGRTGLVPRSEVDIADGRELRQAFYPGAEIKVKLIEVDEERGRYTLSQKAAAAHEEHERVARFRKGSGGDSGKSSGGFGTLGDLLASKLKR